MTPEDILHQARRAGVLLIRFLYCGNDGLVRGKATHIDHLERRLLEGIGLPMAMQSMTIFDRLAPGGHLGPVGEVRLVPDPATFALLPYAPRQARLFCNLVQLDRHPWPLCPRGFLQRMLVQAAQHGIQVQAAFETEFYLLRKDAGQYLPFDISRLYSAAGMDNATGIIIDAVEALSAQGIEVEQYHPEHGPGQQEISVKHTSALHAADQQLAVRETIRGVAQQHGLLASFAPKPFADQAGSGCHMHVSLWDEQGERNLLYDVSDPLRLSPMGYAFIAGVLQHLPALVALTAPSVNSYRRLQPHTWSAAYTCYGPDNREAAVRIASPFWKREMASTNLEFRPCDPSCNPYLALGGLLAAGLDGLVHQCHPGPAVIQNPALLGDDTRQRCGICRLPQTLDDALDALQADTVLSTALGHGLIQEYLIVKRAEAGVFREHDLAFELAQHLEVY
jgi:glutamine synthetase